MDHLRPRGPHDPAGVTAATANPFVRRPWLWFVLPLPAVALVAVLLRDPLIIGLFVLVEIVGSVVLYRTFKAQHDECSGPIPAPGDRSSPDPGAAQHRPVQN